MTATTATTARSNYIDLHVQGLGYISRVNTVVPNGRKKDAFLRATINAMHGERGVEEGIKYVQFDVIARTKQAYDVLKSIEDHCNDRDAKVMVQFKIGDIMPTSFLQTKGQHAGETKLALQGRLLKISHVWLKKRSADLNEKSSYTLIYELPKKSDTEADAPADDGTGTFDEESQQVEQPKAQVPEEPQSVYRHSQRTSMRPARVTSALNERDAVPA